MLTKKDLEIIKEINESVSSYLGENIGEEMSKLEKINNKKLNKFRDSAQKCGKEIPDSKLDDSEIFDGEIKMIRGAKEQTYRTNLKRHIMDARKEVEKLFKKRDKTGTQVYMNHE